MEDLQDKVAKVIWIEANNTEHEIHKKYEELEEISRENDIGYATMQNQIDQVAQDLINSKIQADYMKAGIAVDKKTVEKLSADITNATRGLDLEERKTKVQELLQEFNTGLGAELERGSRILGNTTSAVTDILPQTRTIKKLSETIKEDMNGNRSGEWKNETIKSR